ncbi:hypothetical protein BDV12DRAFT_204427 [Aspergillus spectabilis]
MSYGADNFYGSANPSPHPITFPHHAQLHLPAIVVGYPIGTVKKQSLNLYAQKLAEQRFATVSLVLPFWNGSEGKP